MKKLSEITLWKGFECDQTDSDEDRFIEVKELRSWVIEHIKWLREANTKTERKDLYGMRNYCLTMLMEMFELKEYDLK